MNQRIDLQREKLLSTDKMSAEAGATRWLIIKSIGGSVSLFIWGVIFAVLSAPAFAVISQTRPDLLPFVWLVLMISLISSIGYTKKNFDDMEIFEDVKEMEESERKEYLMYMLFIVIGAYSAHIGVIAAFAGVVSVDLGYALSGIGFAVIYPKVDAYMSRNYALGISQFGYYIALYTLFIVSIISGTSTDIAKTAGKDAKAVV